METLQELKSKREELDKQIAEMEAKDRFHLYQLECKDKEIESYKIVHKTHLETIDGILKEKEELKQMVLHESKEFRKTARELKDGYDNLISEKVKEIEELKKEVPKWISVKKRKLKSGELVLVYTPEKPILDTHVLIGTYWKDSKDLTVNDFERVKDLIVTHWMPIPQPPNQH